MMPGMEMAIPDLHSSAATYPKFKVPNDAVITLTEMNNNCIVMFQMGKPLALGSQESRDLAAYVTYWRSGRVGRTRSGPGDPAPSAGMAAQMAE